MANKEDKAKIEKSKAFEEALDAYGEAKKSGNISMMEKNRVSLLKMAGIDTKQTAANSPTNPKPDAVPKAPAAGHSER